MIATTEVERPLGSTVGLKRDLMEWLYANADGHRIRGNYSTTDLIRILGAPHPDIIRAAYDLQKMGMITFREKKQAGVQHGGVGARSLDRFALTNKAVTANAIAPAFDPPPTPEEIAVAPYAEHIKEEWARRVMKRVNEGYKPAPCTCDLPPNVPLKSVEHTRGCPWAAQQEAMVEAAQALPARDEEMAVEKITAAANAFAPPDDVSPVTEDADLQKPDGVKGYGLLVWWLRHQPGKAGRISEYARFAGLNAKSTVGYQAAERFPDMFSVHKGLVTLTAPDDWEPTSLATNGGNTTKPKAVETVAPALPPIRHLRVALGPLLTDLMARSERRAKVSEAVAALEAAGLDEDALTVLTRIPDDSPLEKEIIDLLTTFGYGKETS